MDTVSNIGSQEKYLTILKQTPEEKNCKKNIKTNDNVMFGRHGVLTMATIHYTNPVEVQTVGGAQKSLNMQ